MKSQITTPRLLLEPLSLKEIPFIFELLNSEGWIKFIGTRNIQSQEDAAKYIQKILDNPDCLYLVFRLKESGQPVGLITLIKREYLEHHDIGFALLPGFERKGYSFEASKQVVQELISSGLHTKILAITMKDNYKSIRLLEKLGLEFEKEIMEDDETLLQYSISLSTIQIK